MKYLVCNGSLGPVGGLPGLQAKAASPAKEFCGDHLKSLRNTTSASAAPTQAKVVVAGLVKVLNTIFKGLSKNVFHSSRALLKECSGISLCHF